MTSGEAKGHGSRAPDFVIAGAAKCGTTALYRYLSTHPGIAMSSRKETYYWCPDVPVRDALDGEAAYQALWAGSPPGVLKGEATPAYLRSTCATQAILEANPHAKFIVMLRSPAEMAASYHAQMLFSLQEDEPDFRLAWELQGTRLQGDHIPGTCFFPPDLHYAEVCALGDQLERMMRLVPSRQLKVVLLDDLSADAHGVYLDVLRFLELENDGRTTFEPINRNRRRKALPLVRLYRRAVSGIRPLGLVARVLRLTPMVDRLSLDETARASLDPEFADAIHAFFLPQVEKLETLLGRDLSIWKTPA